MRINILFTFLILLFICGAGFGQAKQFRYYFDGDFNSTEKSQAIFNGTGTYINGAIELKLYNASDNRLVLIEHCTDSSLHINNGLYQSYFANAVVDSEGNYLNGKKEGLWIRRDTTGRTIDSTAYNNGAKIMQVHFGYRKNGTLGSFTVNDVTNNHFKRTIYNDNGQLRSESDFIGQKGIIKHYDSAMKVEIDTVFGKIQVESSFPGGDQAWNQYIKKRLQKDMDALMRDGKSGTCRLKFIVDKEGNVKQAEALTMRGSKLAELAVNAVSEGPKWLPPNKTGDM